MLKQAKKSPDIDNYLCFLLSNQTNPLGAEVQPNDLYAARSAAGIMLKNDIKSHYKTIPQPSQSYIKSNILDSLRDPNAQIRNIAGNVITELVKQAGLVEWPEILQNLLSLVGNDDTQTTPQTQDGAMSALLKVCEDNKKSLNKAYDGQRPLDFIIPKLLQFMSSPVDKVRANAIAGLNIFIVEKAESLTKNVDTFLARLFDLANDTSEDVRKQICRAIVQIAEVLPGKISPHMEGLVSYMITQQRNVGDSELALDAAEFWLCIAEDKNLRGSLGPYLPNIVPVLLESMVYSEDDVLRLEAEAEDAAAEDREQDIKPTFATTKAVRAGNAGGNPLENRITADSNGGYQEIKDDDDDLSDGELEEYDEDDEEDDPEEQWNLRKCSAAALDVLASVFGKAVFEVTLPYLKSNLTHADWPNREAAVLAIGAIAEGCMDVVQPHLPDLIPFLISLLSDPEPVVRQITCWSLGRYSAWASHLDPAGKEQYFLPMMDGILRRMLDDNKRVQEAAASAFANVEEKAGKELENPKYCEVIARQFAECFAKYKDRNMFILYDCVQTLAEHVGATLQSPELVHNLMPALMGRWEKVQDDSREMFPLNECLSYVVSALGNTFSPYAEPVFQRCANVIYTNLSATMAAVSNKALDTPPPDFLVTSLDLLSAMIQALGPDESGSLMTRITPNIFELLCVCLEDESSDVQQSAYALLGDVAIYTFAPLGASGFLSRFLEILIKQLDLSKPAPDAEESGYAVSNNACWSCGEIAMRAGRETEPYIEEMLQRLYDILCNEKVPQSLHENAAIALGRLGSACPDKIAPHLGTFAPLFLRSMASIDWHDEKAQAMKGMGEVVIVNPGGLQQCLVDYLREVSMAPNYFAIDARAADAYQIFQRVSFSLFFLHGFEFLVLVEF